MMATLRTLKKKHMANTDKESKIRTMHVQNGKQHYFPLCFVQWLHNSRRSQKLARV